MAPAPAGAGQEKHMFMMLKRAAHCVGALGIFAALAACDRQTVDATAQPYEIVTQVRPESLEAYLHMYRQAYGVCANVRAMMNLSPPPPLVAVPANFVTKRSTFLSSGTGYLIRHEEYSVDISDMTPETGCKSRLASAQTEVVVRGGQVRSQRREFDGHTEVDAPAALPPAASKGSSYTEKKMLGGITMRCLSTALRDGLTMDRCAADTASGLLLDGHGNPIVLHAREVVPVTKMVMLTDSVSVQIGKPVSPERIALSGVK